MNGHKCWLLLRWRSIAMRVVRQTKIISSRLSKINIIQALSNYGDSMWPVILS